MIEPAWTRSAAGLAEARHIAVLTGAGMCAESGVPTFRDALTGLWAHFDPVQLRHREAYRADPALVWDWYAFRREMIAKVGANAGHRALADFARDIRAADPDHAERRRPAPAGRQPPGDPALHGNIVEDKWLDARPRPAATSATPPGSPGSPPAAPLRQPLRPDVVWFGENLPLAALDAARDAARACDLMLVVGTSGAVYPAAGLAHVARQAGARVVIVNPQDERARRTGPPLPARAGCHGVAAVVRHSLGRGAHS